MKNAYSTVLSHKWELPSWLHDRHLHGRKHPTHYDYAFDKSDIAVALWGECKFIANAINIDIGLSNWYDVFKMLDIQYNKVTLTMHDIIKISLVVRTIACIYRYNTCKKLTDDFLNGITTDFLINSTIDIVKAQGLG